MMLHEDLTPRPLFLSNEPRNNRRNNPLDDPNKRVPRVPRGNEPPSDPNANGPRFRIPGWAGWIVLAALLIWNIVALTNPFTPARPEVTYSDFITQVQNGNVSEVTLTDRSVQGKFKSGVTVNATGDIGAPNATVPATTPAANPLAGSGGTGIARNVTEFRTTLPVVENPDLLNTLQKQGVKVDVKGADSGGFLSVALNLLLSLLPIALFIGLAVYLGRQVSRGQQGIMGFGRSQARLHDRRASRR